MSVNKLGLNGSIWSPSRTLTRYPRKHKALSTHKRRCSTTCLHAHGLRFAGLQQFNRLWAHARFRCSSPMQPTETRVRTRNRTPGNLDTVCEIQNTAGIVVIHHQRLLENHLSSQVYPHVHLSRASLGCYDATRVSETAPLKGEKGTQKLRIGTLREKDYH
jgi:hypothetical protein